MLIQKSKMDSLLKTYIISFSIVLLYFYIILNNPWNNSNGLTIILFFIISVYALINIASSINKRAYSMDMMHWLFIFIFYGVAGIVQYINNRFVYSIQVDDNKLQMVLLLIILWMFFYKIMYITNFKLRSKRITTKLLEVNLRNNKRFIKVGTLVSLFILIYMINKVGATSFLARNTGKDAFSLNSIAGTLLFTNIARNLVLYIFAISYIHYRNMNYGKLYIILQGLAVLIINSPISMPRYNAGIIYLGILLIMFPSFKRNKRFFVLFLSAFIILFPMINAFRHTSLSEIYFYIPSLLSRTIDNIATNFLHGDYDALSMIINTFDYIKINGISWGHQILGVLFFFVPRSIWNSKPVGSGYTIRVAQGADHTNVSSPLIAEGLMNFGIPGILIFSMFFGKIAAYFDKIYWLKSDITRFIDIIYPFGISMFFFMNRGDLLSSFSFASSHVIIFILLFWLNNLTARLK